jgi:hypothetical protein
MPPRLLMATAWRTICISSASSTPARKAARRPTSAPFAQQTEVQAPIGGEAHAITGTTKRFTDRTNKPDAAFGVGNAVAMGGVGGMHAQIRQL